jgi:cobalt-zinc-cadmium efflux system outer membrane protein
MSERINLKGFIRVLNDTARSGAIFCALFFLSIASVFGGELQLADLINEALQNSPEIKAAGAVASAARHRIPQARSLADPMVSVGYQNDGFSRFTYGVSKDAQWMVSASQAIPFPGKRSLKGEMAAKEAESAQANAHIARFKTIFKVTGFYYDLFLAYRTTDLLKDRAALFSRIEMAAAARYSSGMGSQQEVLMAQTEKYMVRERQEMQRQRIQSTEAMLSAALGRAGDVTFDRPVEPVAHPFDYSLSELIEIARKNSHDIITKEKMVDAALSRVKLAQKDYSPDFTLTANYAARGGVEKDMWSLTTQINIPLYQQTKQKEAVHEAEAMLAAAKYELEATKLMVSSAIQDSHSMMEAAERLTDLYKNALIPKAKQDFEATLSGYVSGKGEASSVISRLKALIDFEILYWEQFTVRERAVVRLTTMAEIHELGQQEHSDHRE